MYVAIPDDMEMWQFVLVCPYELRNAFNHKYAYIHGIPIPLKTSSTELYVIRKVSSKHWNALATTEL